MTPLSRERRNMRLVARLDHLGLTPAKFMRRYGATKARFTYLIRAKSWRPDTLRKVSEALHVDPLYWICEEFDENGEKIGT